MADETLVSIKGNANNGPLVSQAAKSAGRGMVGDYSSSPTFINQAVFFIRRIGESVSV
ncbi:MAG: hypothetical protein NZM29_07700 [Nitrospira sp.]|nr:hypothetical protein [Nitrospira sp.]